MNRQQRRFLSKSGNAEKVYGNVVREEHKRTSEHTAQVALEYFRVTMALALHDLYGFGQGRIDKVLDKMNDYGDCINHDNVKYDELVDFVRDEIGIDFRGDK